VAKKRQECSLGDREQFQRLCNYLDKVSSDTGLSADDDHRVEKQERTYIRAEELADKLQHR
jgi:hypothetical protein